MSWMSTGFMGCGMREAFIYNIIKQGIKVMYMFPFATLCQWFEFMVIILEAIIHIRKIEISLICCMWMG